MADIYNLYFALTLKEEELDLRGRQVVLYLMILYK